MVRLKFDIELKYEIAEQASDFILNIHAAHTACQTVVSERLRLGPSVPQVFVRRWDWSGWGPGATRPMYPWLRSLDRFVHSRRLFASPRSTIPGPV